MMISISLFSSMKNFLIDVSRNWKLEDILSRPISGMVKIVVVVFFIETIQYQDISQDSAFPGLVFGFTKPMIPT